MPRIPTPSAEPDLADRLKAEGLRLGFDRIGIAPAVTPPGHPGYLDWLARGHAAGMDYLQRQATLREHPARLLDGVRSVIVGAIVYGEKAETTDDPALGRIARYARGQDYHPVLWEMLGALLDWLRGEAPGANGRAVADSAPLMERDFARLAGLGWVGKNTMLIDRRIGSFTVLGALLTDVELRPDPPHESSHCGTCTRCLDACPTDAFVGPYDLDARRCISYWTIEHKGAMPDDRAAALHGWAFGCDICQDVCPWNRKAPEGRLPALRAEPGRDRADLIAWLDEPPDDFRKRWKGTALSRSKRRGLLRNAAYLLGSGGVREAIPALIRRLDDEEPKVRSAAAWALGRLGGDEVIAALGRHRDDPDTDVAEAIGRALGRLGAAGDRAEFDQ